MRFQAAVQIDLRKGIGKQEEQKRRAKQKLAKDMGVQTKEGFVKLLIQRHGSVVRAWREAIDLDGNGFRCPA